MTHNIVEITPIYEIQGAGLSSDMAGQMVTVKGVVTGVGRRGFFIQNVKAGPDPLISDALYVYSPKWLAREGALLEVNGKVMDYVKEENLSPEAWLDNVPSNNPAAGKYALVSAMIPLCISPPSSSSPYSNGSLP